MFSYIDPSSMENCKESKSLGRYCQKFARKPCILLNRNSQNWNWKFVLHKIVLHPLEIPGPKPKTQINHKNLTSFLFNSWNFQILFFQYSWKFHVHNLNACISSRINPFITFSEFWQLKGQVWVNLLKKENLWQKSCKFNLFKAFWQSSFNTVLFLEKILHWVVVFDYLPKLKWCQRQAFQGS